MYAHAVAQHLEARLAARSMGGQVGRMRSTSRPHCDQVHPTVQTVAKWGQASPSWSVGDVASWAPQFNDKL
jgi:hypothetical protein